MSDQRKPNSPPASSLSSTRQLLDELDVLMQRMLALPVGDGTSEAKAAAVLEAPPEKVEPLPELGKKTVAPPPAPAKKAPSYLYEPAPAEEAVDTQAEAKAEADDTQAEAEADDTQAEAEADDTQAEAEAATTEAVEKSAEENDPDNFPAFSPGRIRTVSAKKLAALTAGTNVADEPVIQRSRLLAAAAAREGRWWLWPLTLANRTFDLFTHCLGPLGSWLRQRRGRAFLGWLGIALLLAALSWQIILWVAW